MSIDRGHPIVAAWRTLGAHARSCGICGAAGLDALSDDPRRSDFEAYDALCHDGQELFTAWRGAKDGWLELRRQDQERRFMLDHQLWDDGVTADQRAAAVMSMPEDDFRAWLALPDDRRHAQLRALERAGPPLPSSRHAPGPQASPPGTRPAPSGRSTQRGRPPGAPRARATLEPTE